MNQGIMNSNLFLILVIVILIAILVILFIQSKKKNDKVERDFLQSLIENFKPTLGIEKNLDFLLLKMSELIVAPNYSFYLYNPVNQRFILKVVRQSTSDTNIAPSYSGLLPYEKEKFDPPLSLSKDQWTAMAMLTKEGEVPVLTIPVEGGKGMIRIGPVSKVPTKWMKKFVQIGSLLEMPLKSLMDEEEQRRNYEVLETSSNAVKTINRLFYYHVEYIKLIVENCIKAAKPAFALVLESDSTFNRVALSFHLGENIVQRANHSDFSKRLNSIIGERGFAIFRASSDQHAKLSQLIPISDGGYFAVCQFALSGKQYVILLSFPSGPNEDVQKRSSSIKLLWSQLQQYGQIKQRNQQETFAYIEFLKIIADILDQMSPHTIGASKLMANYSMTIAMRMGLSEYQIQSIGLAAYLSNIGYIGLSDGILNKAGLYSDKEYEHMKLHSEVGAAIIENTVALEDVAGYVRHHHERMDGNGYPSQLMNENIPIGARIIAVVQTFLAKINGRNYRDPLPFDEALNLLRDSAGSQLDQKVVSVFLDWYESVRISKHGQNKALGNCWELCCVPSSICSQCPSFKNMEKNCWEFEQNNCRAHGKKCETCFVYTEAMSRKGQANKAVI